MIEYSDFLVVDENRYQELLVDKEYIESRYVKVDFPLDNVIHKNIFVRFYKYRNDEPFQDEEIEEIHEMIQNICHVNFDDDSGIRGDYTEMNSFLCHKKGRYCEKFEKTSLFPNDCIIDNDDHYIVNEKYLFNDKTYYYDVPLYFDSTNMSDCAIGDIKGSNCCYFTISMPSKFRYCILSEKLIIIKNLACELNPVRKHYLQIVGHLNILRGFDNCIEHMIKTKELLEDDGKNPDYIVEYYEGYYYYYKNLDTEQIINNHINGIYTPYFFSENDIEIDFFCIGYAVY